MQAAFGGLFAQYGTDLKIPNRARLAGGAQSLVPETSAAAQSVMAPTLITYAETDSRLAMRPSVEEPPQVQQPQPVGPIEPVSPRP